MGAPGGLTAKTGGLRPGQFGFGFARGGEEDDEGEGGGGPFGGVRAVPPPRLA